MTVKNLKVGDRFLWDKTEYYDYDKTIFDAEILEFSPSKNRVHIKWYNANYNAIYTWVKCEDVKVAEILGKYPKNKNKKNKPEPQIIPIFPREISAT